MKLPKTAVFRVFNIICKIGTLLANKGHVYQVF